MIYKNFNQFKRELLTIFPGPCTKAKLSTANVHTLIIQTDKDLYTGPLLQIAILARKYGLMPKQTDHFSQWVGDTYIEIHSVNDQCYLHFTHNNTQRMLIITWYANSQNI